MLPNSATVADGGAVRRWTFDISPALPLAMTLDAATGVVGGVPLAPQPTTRFVLTASDAAGGGVSATAATRLAIASGAVRASAAPPTGAAVPAAAAATATATAAAPPAVVPHTTRRCWSDPSPSHFLAGCPARAGCGGFRSLYAAKRRCEQLGARCGGVVGERQVHRLRHAGSRRHAVSYQLRAGRVLRKSIDTETAWLRIQCAAATTSPPAPSRHVMDPSDASTWFCFSRTPHSYLAGCVPDGVGCKSFAKLHAAQKACNTVDACGGIVEELTSSRAFRFQLRQGKVPMPSSPHEVAHVKHACP